MIPTENGRKKTKTRKELSGSELTIRITMNKTIHPFIPEKTILVKEKADLPEQVCKKLLTTSEVSPSH